ncbi:MAG: DUF1365 domain-containing protein [Hyphomonas sp.]
MTSARFYSGEVSHQRFGSIVHKLRYRITYLLLDLDQLQEASSRSRFLNIGKRGLLLFNPLDHADGKSHDLAGWVRSKLKEEGGGEDAATIKLLTLPRVFGFVFNPLSVYFVYDATGRLCNILYEVGNTFSERHYYLFSTKLTSVVQKHSCDKSFYVSPFFDVSGAYHFKTLPPGETMSVHIRYDDDKGNKAMTATLTGTASDVTNWSCIKLLARFPLMTVGVVVGIHWHALKLWLKGARYRNHGPKSEEIRTTYSSTSQ